MAGDAGADGGTIAIFDFDRTVTVRGTFTPFLMSTLKKRPWRVVVLPVVALRMIQYVLGGISRKRLKEYMLAAFVPGLARAEIDGFARSFMKKILRRGCRPGALAAVARHRAAGDRLVLATASVDFYAEMFGAELGFDDVVSTRTVWSADDRLSCRIDGENCYGEPKLEMVLAALPEVAAARADYRIVVYSDHVSDLPLMSWADEAVAVNPSAKLRAHAEANGFDIVDWGRS